MPQNWRQEIIGDSPRVVTADQRGDGAGSNANGTIGEKQRKLRRMSETATETLAEDMSNFMKDGDEPMTLEVLFVLQTLSRLFWSVLDRLGLCSDRVMRCRLRSAS